MSFTLCDKSRPHPESGFPVRIFRPAAELLPQIRSNGDIILLRSIRILPYGKVVAMSSFSTTWSISYIPSRINAALMTSSQPKTSKPRPQDLEYMRYLHNWWSTRDLAAPPNDGPTSSYRSVSGSSHKRKFSLIRDIQLDCFYDLVGLVVKTFQGAGNFTIYITDFSKNPMLYAYEWHKVGAGGVGDRNSKWPGPWGQYTLQITLWDAHAIAARNIASVGSYVKLQNVRAKRNGDGRLEGTIHGDRKFIGRVDLQVLTNMNDPRIRELLQRHTEYERRFRNDKCRFEEEMEGKPMDTEKKDEEKQVRKDEGNKNSITPPLYSQSR